MKQPLWYSAAAVVLSMLAMTGTAVVVSDRSDRRSAQTARESERAWCEVIATLDDAYRATPPTTEIGRKLARDIGALRIRFGCPQRT